MIAVPHIIFCISHYMALPVCLYVYALFLSRSRVLSIYVVLYLGTSRSAIYLHLWSLSLSIYISIYILFFRVSLSDKIFLNSGVFPLYIALVISLYVDISPWHA